MKAQWLWTSWAHLVLAAVITLEVLLIAAAVTFIMPRYLSYAQEGWLADGSPDFNAWVSWGFGFLRILLITVRECWWWVVPVVAAWGIFEWRCRSENKALMRLSGMGVIALSLMVVLCLTAAAMVLPLSVLPSMVSARNPEGSVLAEISRIDTALAGLENAIASNDKEGAFRQMIDARNAVGVLAHTGSAATVLAVLRQQSSIDDIRLHIDVADDALQKGCRSAYALGFPTADEIARFKMAYAQFRPPTTRPVAAP